ncbi:MAG: permease-like cell division protein FtsX [Patescibacteria group bacterium]|nr:permease-like cell division protein FtsX [Patescibacteria group bacterium]
MFILIKRIFRSGWQNFLRDKEVAIATVFILFLAISLVTSIFLFKDISQFLTLTIQEKVDISVYLKEGIVEKDILEIKKEISKIPEVKEIEYISQEQALKDFVERHKRNPVLIESVQEVGINPLLASLNIKAWEVNQYVKVSDFLESSNFGDLIEKVDYYERKSLIDKISSFTSSVTSFGIFLSVILIMVAVLITFNTIRLSIYNLKEEIKVQRLVGASNWYIRGPFLVQGAISGVFASLISFFLLALTSWFLSPKIAVFFPELNFFGLFIGNFWALFLLQLITGIGLGAISSTIAIRKYLKV